MLPLILACALASFPQLDGPAVRVLARDEEGFGVAAIVTAERPWAVPIPMVTRSEVVQRVVPGPDGLVVRVEGITDAHAVSLELVAHSVDLQVLIVEGAPVLVGPPTLPTRATIGREARDVLPQIARRDGVTVPLDELDLQVESGRLGDRRVVVVYRRGEDGPWRTEIGPLAALPLDALTTAFLDQRERVRLGGPGAIKGEFLFGSRPYPRHQVDQVFVARMTRVEPSDRVRQPCTVEAVEPGIFELRLPTPAAGEGTHTLLVSVDLPAAEPGDDAIAEPGVFFFGGRSSKDAVGSLVDRAELIGAGQSHLEGPDEQLDIRPTMGPGVAWGDVDADGRVDLYLVQGGGRVEAEVSANRLLANDGRLFADVTAEAGGADRGAGMAALFLDGDGDGDLDLYVANYGADTLFANEPALRDECSVSRRFWRNLVNVSATAGVRGAGNDDKWSAGIAASDYDRDGDLDLYVTSYLVYDPALMPPVGELAYSREDPIEMLPFAFPGQANTFLRNESDASGMRFVDVTEELGVADEQGRGMQAVFLDFDRDGDDDLYVANDVSYNVLFRNEGDGTFKDVSFSVGLDDPRGGMGLAVGDVDGDGDEDVFLTNWELEPNALYLNNLLSNKSQKHHVATFRDGIVASGLGPSGIGRTSWGCELFDFENDGDLDLFVANGYTSPDYESTGICVGQPNQLFENDGTGKFTDASAQAGPDVTRKLPSRAAVGCDFDRDGDVDLVVTTNNGPVQLLVNELPPADKGHWLLVRLRGAGGNTHGIGAEITVKAGGRTWRRELRAGTSYLGGNPPELHFGLGQAATVESIEVRWPSGKTTTHMLDGVDRVVQLAE